MVSTETGTQLEKLSGGWGELSEARVLAKAHVPRAITRLVELMECDGRQSGVAAAACRAIVDIAEGTEADKVIKAVKSHLDSLLGEAERLEEVERQKALLDGAAK